MDRQQWLEWRRGGIGSSDAPVIMGLSKWKNPHQLWEEKVFGKEDDRDSLSMKRGRDLEEIARKKFESLMNISVFPKNVTHNKLDWARASLDGIDLDQTVLVEIKCPGNKDHSVALNNMIPEKYMAQCQHQLFVTGLSMMYYYSFDGENGKAVEVGRDHDYIELLFQKEKEFWDHVLEKKPLAVDMSENTQWQELISYWQDASSRLKAAEKEEKELRKSLIGLSEGKDAFGHGVRIIRSDPEGRIDYKRALEELYGPVSEEILDTYRTESSTRFTIKAI